ncbi:DUF2812 domain-containing protein [Lysinibacillus xylanilyticus]|uniref:DUF2812 domain-containing protein n=1 Tax=Lysinibacillus xylanilyticus TaxID=582475 RepID=UPI003D05AC8E
MIKFKLFFNMDKEEKWLNAMLQEGWMCTKISPFGYYTLKRTSDTEQVIRIDFQQDLRKEARENYVQLHKDFGWQAIKGKSNDGTYYWIKDKDGHDELFSDNDSQIAKYKRLMKHASFWAILSFAFLMVIYSSYDYPLFFDLKGAYFTPGLWDKEGLSFLFAFLFETPFALMRFIPPWLFIATSVIYALTYIRYRKAIQHLVQ